MASWATPLLGIHRPAECRCQTGGTTPSPGDDLRLGSRLIAVTRHRVYVTQS